MTALFTIHCTTCNARLKVNDPKAIGQILACPKCGSMVLVEGDAQSPQEAITTGDSETATELVDSSVTASASVADQDQSAAAAPPSAQSSRSQTAQDNAAPVADPAGDVTDAKSPPVSTTGKPRFRVSDTDQLGGPMLPNDQWESASSQRVKQIALIAGAALGGITLAVVLLVWISAWMNSDNDESRQPTLAQAGKEQPSGESVPPGTSQDYGPTNDPDADAPRRPISETPVAGDVGTDPEMPHDGTDPTTPSDDDPPLADPPQSQTPTDGAQQPVDDDSPPPAVTDQDPELTKGEPPAEPETDVSDDPLKDLESLLDSEVGSAPDEPDDRPRTPERQIDVELQLAQPLVGVEFSGLPLARFCEFISQITTIPVTLDLEALAATGFSPATTVEANMTETTVAELLRTTLAPLGLAARTDASRITVTLAIAPGEPTLPIGFDPLVPGTAEQVQALAKLVQTLAEPGQDPPATRVEGQQLLVPAARAMVARLALTRLHQARLNASSAQLAAPAAFDKPLTANFLRPTPLTEILDYLRRTSEVEMLVDWNATATGSVLPWTELTLTATDLPLADVLDRLLSPLELVVRYVDERTIQITTSAALEGALEIRAFPIGDLLEKASTDAAYLQERLQTTLGREKFVGPDAVGAICYDEVSRCLLVRLPYREQMNVHDLMEAWRK